MMRCMLQNVSKGSSSLQSLRGRMLKGAGANWHICPVHAGPPCQPDWRQHRHQLRLRQLRFDLALDTELRGRDTVRAGLHTHPGRLTVLAPEVDAAASGTCGTAALFREPHFLKQHNCRLC